MPVLVVLLRGINVGGRTRLPMADLRAVAGGLGYRDVATYIQSGNLVCTTDDPPEAVARALPRALEEAVGFGPPVVVRTRDQLAAALEADPFLARGEPEDHIQLVFCERAPTEALATLDLTAFTPEEVVAVGDDLHLLLPGGVGRSPLATALTRKGVTGAGGTMRNLRTTRRLLAMADEAGAAS